MAEREPVFGPGLLLALERGTGETLHEQLERRLRERIRSGALAPGSRIPSSRALARELGISRGVVLEAYSQLIAEGYLFSSHGAPTRVALAAAAERPPIPASSLQPRYQIDFHPGLPDLGAFPRDSWSRSLRLAVRAAPFDALGQDDPRGSPLLRNGLMTYLGRVRGAAPEPEHTVICSGFTQGFAVVCRALRGRGLERVAVEEPGWARHRLIAQAAGLEPVPIAVDGEGLDVDALRGCGCEVVVVTPAHQFPTGAVLSSDRRAALLEWAEEADGLIVEDDYDSELRYDRVAVGALQGLAPERVCNIGSLSKRLAPALRLGWILSPSWLSGALTYEKGVADGGSPAIEQHALSDFIERGELDRHLRRMRARYRARRETLAEALARCLPGARVAGVAAGLFVLVTLEGGDRGLSEERVLSEAAARGVGLEGLGWHRAGPSAGEPAGLVLGFANLSDAAIARGISLLAEAVRSGS